MLYIIRYHWEDIKLYELGPAFSFVESITSQDHPARRTSADMELRKTTQNLNIYLHNYQTETAIFLATKHEKTIMLWHAVI